MRKMWSGVLAAAALAAVGCVQAEQAFTLKADGSAELKFSYAMSEQTVAQIEAMQKMAKDNPNVKTQGSLGFDEKSIRETFDKLKDSGVELTKLSVESKDGTRRIALEAGCKDIVAASKAAGGDKAAGISLVKNADGNYVMTFGGGDLAGMGGGNLPEEQKKQQQAMAKAMMAGFKATLSVTLPADVVESNGMKTEGRTVSWVMDIAAADFFDTMDKLGKEGMRTTFKGAGLNLKEIKPEPAKVEPKEGGEAEPE